MSDTNADATPDADNDDATNGDGTATRPVALDDEAALDDFLAASSVTLVEFYTDGCGICSSMEPVVGNLARELDIDVATINPRDDPPLVERFDVRSVPLFVLFEDGEPIARRADGFIEGDDLTAWIRDRTTRPV